MTEIIFRDDVDVDLMRHMANDMYVAEAAWVSTKGWDAPEGDRARIPALINFLARDRHGSPFEHSVFTWRISAPLFVIREYQRHRIASYNEESGRYTQLKPVFYVPRDGRNLVQKGKPGAYFFSPGSRVQEKLVQRVIAGYSRAAFRGYEYLLSKGIAKEVSRMILPLNIYSSFYVTMNARALMNFLSLRTENETSLFPSHPQFEIQLVANKMERDFKEQMPITYEAWNKNGRVAP